MPETLLIKSDFEQFTAWVEAFKNHDITVVDWQDSHPADSIDYALVWQPSAGALAGYPNLKIIFSVGAGLDHLKGVGVVPPNIPVVRMVEPGLTAGMVEYVVYHVLGFHRFMPRYAAQQQQRQWREFVQIPAEQRSVGILGLGELGAACAKRLMAFGFRVLGWSQNEKQIDGVKSYYGDSQLADMLGQSQILVCLLPLTERTAGILNQQNLQQLPKGAYLINAGRGGCQIAADVMAALDSGQLEGAALDVFDGEPLAHNDLLWNHPGVIITPHIASMTLPISSADAVYKNIRRYRNGEPLEHLANMQRGY